MGNLYLYELKVLIRLDQRYLFKQTHREIDSSGFPEYLQTREDIISQSRGQIYTLFEVKRLVHNNRVYMKLTLTRRNCLKTYDV